MDKLIMQNSFFGHTEGTKKVSAGLKNTKNTYPECRDGWQGRLCKMLLHLLQVFGAFPFLLIHFVYCADTCRAKIRAYQHMHVCVPIMEH